MKDIIKNIINHEGFVELNNLTDRQEADLYKLAFRLSIGYIGGLLKDENGVNEQLINQMKDIDTNLISKSKEELNKMYKSLGYPQI